LEQESNKILLIGNSYTIPSLTVPLPFPLLLKLENKIEDFGATLDYQAEMILKEPGVNYEYIVWIIGHHHRADPKADKDFIIPYKWKDTDTWADLTKNLWFKKMTTIKWHYRLGVLSVLAVLSKISIENILLIPLYRPNVLESPELNEYPNIMWDYLGDYRKKYPDGSGHMNQLAHKIFAAKLKEEIENRWKISLTLKSSPL